MSEKQKIKTMKHGHVLAIALVSVVIAILLWGFVFVQYKVSEVRAEGIVLNLPTGSVVIPAAQVNFSQNGMVWLKAVVSGKPTYDTHAMSIAIADASVGIGSTVKNPGVTIQNGLASLDSTSAPGLALDQDMANSDVATKLRFLQNQITVKMVQEQPTVSIAAATQAVAMVQRILANPVNVSISNAKQVATPATIGGWVTQNAQNGKDVISFNTQAIAASLKQLAAPYSQPEQDLDFDYDNNHNVINLIAPKDGIGIDATAGANDMVALLQARIDGTAQTTTPTLTLALQKVSGGVSVHAQSLGIQQLIGTATTPFTGSTKNRIHNITTGATKLNGVVVPAAQEFSTIKTLGDIGPETGYVEELVILGPNTVPAYGGGLCQVSTTLFRAILNAGLPITERQNHSYRVSFYEKDGDGKSIGPGLDATIYDPSPDLKFMNDTAHPVMITDQIVGTKITFNLYGTSDGRSSTIIGPTIVQTLPAPPAETVYSATLPPGEVKQTEFSHTGADTTATYEIHYANGTTKTQVFTSHYHGLPAIYITNDPSAAPAAAAAPTTTTPSPATPAD